MLRSTLVILSLAFSVSATAADFDYNYFSIGYGTMDFDEVGADGDGFGAEGSFAINDSYHVFGGYESAGLDFGVDATSFAAGFGYNRSMSDTVDLVARLSYEYVDFDVPGPVDIDDSGIGLGVGLRIAASNELELDVGINYVDYSDLGDDTAFAAGGLYNFTDSFSLGLAGSWSDDVSSYTLSGRFYFGE
jgi:hypothetical protein